MAKPTTGRRIVLSPAARQDIRDVLRWSIEKFGSHAEKRYRELLIQAFRDLERDLALPGSVARPELAEGARTYHLALSRRRLAGGRVKAPRHFILYRIGGSGIEVARILHDQRDLERHLPEEFRA